MSTEQAKKNPQTFKMRLNLCLKWRHFREHKGLVEICHIQSFHTNSHCWQNTLHCYSCYTTKCKVQFFPGVKAWKKWHFKYFPSLWGVWETYFYASWNPKDLFNLPRPSLPTMTHLSSLRTGDAMRNRGAIAGIWILSYYIFTLSIFFLTNIVCWTKWYAPWQGIWTSGYRPGFS